MNREMTQLSLTELRKGFMGKPFHRLIQHHLKRQSQHQRIQGIHGTIAMLPEGARSLMESFIDKWNGRAYDQAFYAKKGTQPFSEKLAGKKI